MVEYMATTPVGFNSHFTLVWSVRPEQSPIEANGTDAHAWATQQVNHHRVFEDDHVIIIVVVVVAVDVVVGVVGVVVSCWRLVQRNSGLVDGEE
jgi:hypothetical protein